MSFNEPAETPIEDIVAAQEPSELELIAAERDAARDDHLRTLAEFQNFRRRAQQERADLIKTGSQDLVKDLLPVLDNFERTLAAAQSGASLESLVEGVQVVERQLRSILEKRHVERIPTVGQHFDPHVHEPIGTDATEEFDEDTVTLEIEAGYKMGDKVLRPARVKVAKKP